jgi:hypothetical protein
VDERGAVIRELIGISPLERLLPSTCAYPRLSVSISVRHGVRNESAAGGAGRVGARVVPGGALAPDALGRAQGRGRQRAANFHLVQSETRAVLSLR